MSDQSKQRRCKSRTKQGKPCRAAATAGGLCFFHSSPNKAVELGRIGGRNKSRSHSQVLEETPRLDKVSAVRDFVGKLISDVHAGTLHPRFAAGLAPLLTLQLRVIAATDLERRVEELERKSASQQPDGRVEP